MNGETLGAKFTIDISDLKAGVAQANRLIKESKSEFKAAAAGMDDWTKSEEGLMAKKKQLTNTLEVQNEVLNAYEEQLKEAGYAEDDMSRDAVELRTKINNQKAEIAATEKELSKMDTALEELRSSSNEAETAIDDMGDAARRTGDALDDMDGASQTAGEGFTVLKGTLANLVADGINRAVEGIKGLVGEAITASDALYKFEQTMGFAGYDDKTIQKAKTDMKDYADKTVYDLETISNTTAQLAANGIKDYTGLTEAAGNLNAVAGGNADTFGSVAMVMTQTAGAGKLTTENWNQLADAIPGASGKLQEAMKKNGAFTGNFREAMEKGEITADEFNQAIMDLGNEPVAVEAAKSTETFEGAVGNMQAAVVNGLMQIIDAIGMENITGFINGVTSGIETTVKAIGKVTSFVKKNSGIILASLAAISTALLGIFALGGGFTVMAASLKAWAVATKAVTAVQWLLNAALNANPIGLVIVAIAALVAAFVVLWKKCEGFRNFWKNLWNGIKNIASKAWISIKGFFASVPGFFREKFNGAYTAIKNVFNKLPTFFSNLWGKIKSTFSTLGTKIGNAISGAVKTAINGVVSLIENRINTAIGLINGAIGMINKLPKVHVGKISKLHLPRMAEGGVVTRATNAIIGEDGAEAVVPLKRNTEWIDRVAEAVVNKAGGAGVVVNQTNNYSQAHSRYEIYKSKKQTEAAVRLALLGSV